MQPNINRATNQDSGFFSNLSSSSMEAGVVFTSAIGGAFKAVKDTVSTRTPTNDWRDFFVPATKGVLAGIAAGAAAKAAIESVKYVETSMRDAIESSQTRMPEATPSILPSERVLRRVIGYSDKAGPSNAKERFGFTIPDLSKDFIAYQDRHTGTSEGIRMVLMYYNASEQTAYLFKYRNREHARWGFDQIAEKQSLDIYSIAQNAPIRNVLIRKTAASTPVLSDYRSTDYPNYHDSSDDE